ncbi:MMPL family transporter [Anaerocolumna xylanovorans]|uniref:Putative drug exporter of the RND superfamily n=1 Tax=Anaerocolumna xylanovorans DSM 12503 TaxID=1121345 RepID=A0A1M7XWM1_9FIRM|nr:MMPL family transporter [Anaerocolumna xylanovorans]SHO43152.1 putative drug exporter of the RND superfamily [Anaerocolumna xylanovorans DSM 12503]
MRNMIRFRYLILAVWVAVTVLFVLNQPDLSSILGGKGEATLQEDSPSNVAQKMLDDMSSSNGDTLIVVFHSDNALSTNDMDNISKGLDKLNADKDSLKITNLIDPFGTPSAKDQLISEDKTTLMVQVTYDLADRNRKEILDSFETAVKDIPVEHYITGGPAIANDYMNTVNKGVEKSGAITIIFILIVLILMFRSAVTPIVSLLAVGISYICSMGIIGVLNSAFGFPITNFTQMFIIVVLFGIGTDYHILLLNRFKEELSHGLSVDDAVIKSLKTSGKTILYSGLTVFMGFVSLSFVQFPVYRSANSVAIGIAILLLEILTLTPVLMRLLGPRLFWPSKASAGHKESKFWAGLTSNSVKHPILSLLIVAAVIVPVIFFNTTKLSFDSMADMPSDTPSVKGFHIIADEFGAGKAMPVTLVIKNKDAMDNNEALAALDNLTETLKTVNGIALVSGPTQPLGKPISDLYTDSQLKTVTKGLSDAKDGIGKVNDGLDTIEKQLSVPDFSQLNDLNSGTGDLTKGLSAVNDGLKAVDSGIKQGADGAASLADGAAKLKTGITTLNQGLKAINTNFNKVKTGYVSLSDGYTTLGTSIGQLKQLEQLMEASVGNLDKKLPGDVDVAALKAYLATLSKSLDQLSLGMTQANTNYAMLNKGLDQISIALSSVITNTSSDSELMKGISQLEAGAKVLNTGLKEGNKGQQQIIANMDKLKTGAGQVQEGVSTLTNNLTTLASGISDLKNGIITGKNGLTKITDGLTQGSDFLNQLTAAKSFYIPEEALSTDDITTMLNAYMSDDRTYARVTINLDTEPYADSSIQLMNTLNEVVKSHLNGTVLSDAKFGFAGATALSKDMSDMATHDITFTQIIVLAAIFILLILVTRSFWIPVYIIGSLIAAYYTSLSVTSWLSDMLFHNPGGMAWNVPFFAFVMIAALGVDYSIFLMERFREYPELPAKEAIIQAARHVGSVVLSAAVILSGTFATLYPSNLVILMELAIAVVIGLMLLSLVFLPVVIPALIDIQDKIMEHTDYSKKINKV